MANRSPNALHKEASAYLLQHAYNPINWQPWDNAVLEQAASQNKLLVISIGYAACHWCHVMENEVFDNQEVASLMNQYFVSIKVDREERPDIDQVYMEALQVLTQSGGWPLNIVALPDGRPLWGCTYLPRQDWMQVLTKIVQIQKEDPQKLLDYGEELLNHLGNEIESKIVSNTSLDFQKIQSKLLLNQDLEYGGYHPPKFMMPVLLDAFQSIAGANANHPLYQQWDKTLEKVALGGIHDVIGGGIARYAIDKHWHIPHFEKMAYDNGQLLNSYCRAYRISKNPLYKETVESIIRFINEELTNPNGTFYSAIDADSANNMGVKEEGAYYIWTKDELENLLGADAALFFKYYNVNAFGHWEDEKYVLIRDQNAVAFSKAHAIDFAHFDTKNRGWLKTLEEYRKKRPAPFKDQKIVLAWNALVSKGLLDAYRTFGSLKILNRALKNLDYLFTHYVEKSGKVYRIIHDDTKKISGFLDDYALLIEACIFCYETVFETLWLDRASLLTNYCLTHFKAYKSPYFFYTATQDHSLIVRKKELEDNVIPSSNALMADNLYRLSAHLNRMDWKKNAVEMLEAILPKIEQYPKGYGRWIQLYWCHHKGLRELVVVGADYKAIMAKIHQHQFSNTLLAAAANDNQLPLIKNRFKKNKTLIYLCENNRCLQPETKLNAVLKNLKA